MVHGSCMSCTALDEVTWAFHRVHKQLTNHQFEYHKLFPCFPSFRPEKSVSTPIVSKKQRIFIFFKFNCKFPALGCFSCFKNCVNVPAKVSFSCDILKSSATVIFCGGGGGGRLGLLALGFPLYWCLNGFFR